MNINYGMMKQELIRLGLDEKRAAFLVSKFQDEDFGTVTDAEAEWALKRGFIPNRVAIYGLTEENYRSYLSDLDYFMMHPLNNHFRIWINDKLTTKYVLSGSDVAAYMPAYYLYIENDGQYTYLADAPESIAKDKDFIRNLLTLKGELVLKSNNGAGGAGFVHLELRGTEIYKNGKCISESDYEALLPKLNGYVITEYIHQHKELNSIYDGAEQVLRIIVCKNVKKDKTGSDSFSTLAAYTRFGTAKCESIVNMPDGGIDVPYDENGVLRKYGIMLKKNCEDGNNLLTHHPNTNFRFEGYQLPNYAMVKEAVEKTCRYLSSLDWFGFDVIIADDGVKYTEINTLPDIDYAQYVSGPFLVTQEAKDFFAKKKTKTYPEDALWTIVKKCME